MLVLGWREDGGGRTKARVVPTPKSRRRKKRRDPPLPINGMAAILISACSAFFVCACERGFETSGVRSKQEEQVAAGEAKHDVWILYYYYSLLYMNHTKHYNDCPSLSNMMVIMFPWWWKWWVGNSLVFIAPCLSLSPKAVLLKGSGREVTLLSRDGPRIIKYLMVRC